MKMSCDNKNFSRSISNELIIGRGSYGEVYGPCDWNGKKCAIKKRWLTNVTLEDIEKELSACRKWKSLHHRSLITVYDISHETHAVYIIMEYASGGSLFAVLPALKSDLHLDILIDWALQIADGMAFLHENDIVYRDLKSPNIVLMEADASSNPQNKTLKITDFDQIREHKGTKTMSRAGTCAWTAPEVLIGGKFSKASDVWSYGVVLWEILTRTVPHEDVPENLMFVRTLKGPPLKLKIPHSCPNIIKSILNRCLNNETRKRPAFGEILLELQPHRNRMMTFFNNASPLQKWKNISSKARGTIKEKIRKHAGFLEHFMEPDFGLLDNILEKGIIEWKEMEDIIDTKPSWKRNSKLLEYILSKDQTDGLIAALLQADQKHIVNFLKASGEYSDAFGEDWPLTDDELKIFDTNRSCLVEILILTELLDHLFSSKVVNNRQVSSISSMPTPHEKNQKLLDILRRRSLRDYLQTIECLRRTHQGHIADILDEGGAVLGLHVNLRGENVSESEEEIAKAIANIIMDSPIDQPVRIIFERASKIIAAKTGQSVVLYIYCRTIEELEQLHDALFSSELAHSVELWFNSLLNRSQKIAVTAITISDEELRKLRVYFKGTEDPTSMITELPLEMLDVVLENSFLHWTLNSSTNQRDQDVIRTLASVDYCWFQRITRRRLKRRIWLRLKGFYKRTKKRSGIIRNNQDFLLDNIEPDDKLIASALSVNCITEEQRYLIQRQRLNQKQRRKRDKNTELLHFMRSIDDAKFAKLIKCLRQTDQKRVARIMENGGVVVNVEVPNHIGAHYLNEKFKDLQDRTKPWSPLTDKLISQLNEKGIEIRDSELVVEIACRSQTALENIQSLYESNQLKEILLGLTNILPSSQITKSMAINIDSCQFKKTIVECQISINFTERIVKEDKDVYGATKLRNKIYVLCHSYSHPSVIRVFEDQNPFCFQKEIELNEMKFPVDIGSSARDNCLYVSDYDEKCVWKITKETSDEYIIVKWVTTDRELDTLSVSSDGQLLVVDSYRSILSIYESDTSLLRSVQLPDDIKNPRHAVKTSIGNCIIIHQCMEVNKEKSMSSGKENEINWVLSELNKDGKIVIRRFAPSNETKQLIDPKHLSIDSDGQVFVVDKGNHGVVILDSNLKWSRILCPTKEPKETIVQWPRRLFYDEENKQLIVGGDKGANVYTLSLR